MIRGRPLRPQAAGRTFGYSDATRGKHLWSNPMSNINPNPFTTRPEIEGTFGVVTSTHWIATAVGMSILEKGGNAFDAACATAFTLQVVEPHLNGPGGDVPVILFDVRKGHPEVICGQGPAPAGATIAHYRGLGLDMVPGAGLLAACVPGMFDAFMILLRDYGTMRLADVLAGAIFYASEGHPLVERANATIATVEKLFRQHWPSSAAVYLRDGKVPGTGTLFSNPALAETYKRVLREAAGPGSREQEIERARRVWSQGFVAEAIDRFCRSQEIMDTSGHRNRGVLTGHDMARWQATLEAPLTYQYGRYTVCKPGPWAQGPVMLQQLALLKGFHLDGLDVTGAEFIHTVVEASKLAFADREKFYGDPQFERVPIETLLSDAYNEERRKLIHHTASLELRPGSVEGFGAVITLKPPSAFAATQTGEGREGAAAAAMGAGEPTVGRLGEMRGDTVHFDIVDRAGNMVSATPSGGWLQSSPVIPELGFGLGTRAQMFWLEENHPASLKPGKRPRTTLSPTLALRDGEPYLAWGSPGGDQQDQWTTQFFLRHVHARLNLQEAIDAPAWHSEHFPISFWPRTARPGALIVESRVPAESRKELEKRGHIVELGPAWSEGRLTAASRDGRRRKAAANPRGMQGYAAGR
jgi:gamma-glutamyltranspeptidase / glutathione hydrolase